MVIATSFTNNANPAIWKTQELVLPNNYYKILGEPNGPRGTAEIRVDYFQDVETV